MSISIYVGNLDPQSHSDEIRQLFEAFGIVESVELIADKGTGHPRGFGFVKMDTQPGRNAIAELDGTALNGRNLQISEARPRSLGGANRARGGAFGNGGGKRR